MIFLFKYYLPFLVDPLSFVFQIIQYRNFVNSRTCGSIISFEGKISCFFNINCNFLLQIWLRAFACIQVLPDYIIRVPNLTVLLQGWTHQPLISCSFNVLMNSRTCWSIISFEGEIGMEANDLVNCIPERGHNWIIKHSVLFNLLSDASLLCQQSSALTGFGIMPVFDV